MAQISLRGIDPAILDLMVSDLVEDPADLSIGELNRIRSIALGEPLLVNHLISPKGHESPSEE